MNLTHDNERLAFDYNFWAITFKFPKQERCVTRARRAVPVAEHGGCETSIYKAVGVID